MHGCSETKCIYECINFSYQVLPYFMKSEKNLVKSEVPYMRGQSGPITVSEVPWKSKSAQHFVKAAKQLGIPYLDYNGRTQVGVSYLQTSTQNGQRVSSNVCVILQNLEIRFTNLINSN